MTCYIKSILYKKEKVYTEDDIDSLYKLLKEFSDYNNLPKNDTNLINRALYVLYENNIDFAIEIAQIIPDDINNYPLMSLKVKIYSSKKESLLKAVKITTSMKIVNMNKRLYLPLLEGYIKWYKKKAFKFLWSVHTYFPIVYKDIKPFIDNPDCFNIFDLDYEKLYKIIEKHNIVLDENIGLYDEYGNPYSLLDIEYECPHCGIELERISLPESKIEDIRSMFSKKYFSNKKVQKAIQTFEIFCNKKVKQDTPYNIFVDGNNILYFKDRSINFYSFKRIESAYNKLVALGYRPLIIMHRRHRDNLTKYKQFQKSKEAIFDILSKCDIYYTPYSINDDLFFIWGGFITKDSYVVSNDKFRDHIYNTSGLLSPTGGGTSSKKNNKVSSTQIYDDSNINQYLKEIMVFYTCDKRNNISYQFPPRISHVAQMNSGNKWHIPVNNGKWICSN